MKLFVPGRICLLGEHSDWAGGYRRINADVEKGYTLITGTNQGVYAEIKPHPNKLVIHTTLPDGSRKDPHEIDMDPDALMAEAQRADLSKKNIDNSKHFCAKWLLLKLGKRKGKHSP